MTSRSVLGICPKCGLAHQIIPNGFVTEVSCPMTPDPTAAKDRVNRFIEARDGPARFVLYLTIGCGLIQVALFLIACHAWVAMVNHGGFHGH